MRLTKKDSLYQLTFLPNVFPVNCYIVEEETELTLIDAALPYSHKAILKTAKEIGKPISRIVITHVHFDHIGSLDALKKALPNAIVYVSKRDAKLMEYDLSLEPNEIQTPIKGDIPKSLKTRADVLLNEGDQIGSLTAISTPGHTPGSMSFLDERNRFLIAGDALQTRGGIAVAGKIKITFPFPAFGTWSLEVANESAKKLVTYKPNILAVGHGLMLANPVQKMETAIAAAEQSLGEAIHGKKSY